MRKIRRGKDAILITGKPGLEAARKGRRGDGNEAFFAAKFRKKLQKAARFAANMRWFAPKFAPIKVF